MAKLTIWQAGVKVYPIENETTTPSVEPEIDRFNTCIHRGENEETKTRQTCCNTITRTGYMCNKLGIFPVTPARCQECLVYQAKEAQS